MARKLKKRKARTRAKKRKLSEFARTELLDQPKAPHLYTREEVDFEVKAAIEQSRFHTNVHGFIKMVDSLPEQEARNGTHIVSIGVDTAKSVAKALRNAGWK